MTRLVNLFNGLILILLATAVAAHHGPFQYDLEVEVTYQGKVVEHKFKNPHSLTILEITTPENETRLLSIHGDGPASLSSSGIRGNEIRAGDKVKVTVSPSIDDPDHAALGHELVKEDGTIVPLSRGRVRD